MKIPSLFCVAALLMLPAGSALAKSGTQAGAKTRTPLVHKRVHAVRPVQPSPSKDPWAAYWNDPTRRGPFSYRGDYR